MRKPERLRWRPTWASILIVLYFLWELIGQPIWNLNVERVAEQREIDGTLRDSLPSVGGVAVPNAIIEWIDYLTGPFLTGFVIAAALFGLGPSIAGIIKSGATKARQRSSKTSTPKPNASGPQEHEREVIPVELRIWGTLTDDGVDIAPQIIYRNRSQFNLSLKATKALYLLESKAPPDRPSQGFSGALNKEKNYEVSFNPIRIYDTDRRPSGIAEIEFMYGPKTDEFTTAVGISYTFTVLSMPKTKGKREKLKVSALSNVTYEDI